MTTRRRLRRRGQAMVEFAMVAPFLFLLVFGVIEGGRFVFYYSMLNAATREGARYAIVHGSNSSCPSGPMPDGSTSCDPSGANVKDAVRRGAAGLVGIGEFRTLEVSWCTTGDVVACQGAPGNNGRGMVVIVHAIYEYRPSLPVLPMIGVESESTLVINN